MLALDVVNNKGCVWPQAALSKEGGTKPSVPSP